MGPAGSGRVADLTDEGRQETAGLASHGLGRVAWCGLFSRKVNITALFFLGGIYLFWNTVAGQAGISCRACVRHRRLALAGRAPEPAAGSAWGCTVVATYFDSCTPTDEPTSALASVPRSGIACVGKARCSIINGVPTMLAFAVL